MKRNIHLIIVSLLAVLMGFSACTSNPSVPAAAIQVDTIPSIYPDYTDVTVPCNIAPLNFMLSDTLSTQCVARFTTPDGKTQTYGSGTKVLIPQSDWEQMKQAALGKDVKVEVFAQTADKWYAYQPFSIHIAPDSIDSYVSYRLIQPSYGLYDRMYISQRNISNFNEYEIFNNRVACGKKEGQCINCHSYQNYRTSNMLFHVRVTNGGTVIVSDGKATKRNLKRPETISAGVYPAWHPTQKLIAFSTDLTHQWFHTSHRNKIEVFDDASDLVLYDVETDQVTTICADTTRLEVFPAWSPDGNYLYYCSADTWKPDSTNTGDYRLDYESVHYNLYRRSFNIKDHSFGPEEIVYQADTLGRSVSLPRLSPDGRYITFAEGDYGYFNIWHCEADIRVIDLTTGHFVPTNQMNSPMYAESYPSFSSNGRWMMCASRRDDGNYSRIYFAYFDGKKAHKAFLLPQADPEHNVLRLFSYNRPEFTIEPVGLSLEEFAQVVSAE